MKFENLTNEDKNLIQKANEMFLKRRRGISPVTAALRSKGSRRIFVGFCIDIGGPEIGICAEMSAIGSMVTAGENEIDTVVAVSRKGGGAIKILPPCGRCREFMRKFGNPYVIVEVKRGLIKKTRLTDLIPFHSL